LTPQVCFSTILTPQIRDFTKLVSRLRESEKFVFGVGEKKTLVSFRNACDDFVYTENLGSADKTEKDTKEGPLQDKGNLDEVVPLLHKAWKQFQDDDGWVNIGAAGSFLKRAQPDFDPRSYGVTKMTQVVQMLNRVFEMKKKREGTTQVVLYRPKSK
jgi:hypothetical protein